MAATPGARYPGVVSAKSRRDGFDDEGWRHPCVQPDQWPCDLLWTSAPPAPELIRSTRHIHERVNVGLMGESEVANHDHSERLDRLLAGAALRGEVTLQRLYDPLIAVAQENHAQ